MNGMCNPFRVGARYHHGRLREALLVASREILAESGARGLSLREAARRAGVSSAAPYRHFQDKAALLVALAHAAFSRLDVELEEVARAHADSPPLERVQRLGVTYVGFAARNPAEFRLMFGELAPAPESSPELAAITASTASHLPRALEDLRFEEGSESPPLVNLTLLAWSIVHGLSTLWLDGHLRYFGDQSVELITEQVTSVLIAALRGRIRTKDPA